MLAHLFALGRFLGACSGFCGVLLPRWADFGASWRAPGLILEGSGQFGGGFWSSRALLFDLFACMRACVVETFRMSQNHNFNGSEHTKTIRGGVPTPDACWTTATRSFLELETLMDSLSN